MRVDEIQTTTFLKYLVVWKVTELRGDLVNMRISCTGTVRKLYHSVVSRSTVIDVILLNIEQCQLIGRCRWMEILVRTVHIA